MRKWGCRWGAASPTPRADPEAAPMTPAAEATQKSRKGTSPTPETPTVPTPAADAATPAKTAPKEKTPEQRAAAMRREAGELRRSAKTLGEATEGGKSLVLRAAGLETDADAISPRKTKSSESRPVCEGTKKDGTACSAHAMEGSVFCTDHRPVRARFTDAQWAAFQRIPTATLVDRLGWGVALKLADAQIAAEQAPTGDAKAFPLD